MPALLVKVEIDNLTELPKSIFLVPLVKATPEAIEALQEADVILFGPGSFLTSILPPILLPEVIEALQKKSRKRKYLSINLALEQSPAASLSLSDRIQWIHHTVGKEIIDATIVPTNAKRLVREFILESDGSPITGR